MKNHKGEEKPQDVLIFPYYDIGKRDTQSFKLLQKKSQEGVMVKRYVTSALRDLIGLKGVKICEKEKMIYFQTKNKVLHISAHSYPKKVKTSRSINWKA